MKRIVLLFITILVVLQLFSFVFADEVDIDYPNRSNDRPATTLTNQNVLEETDNIDYKEISLGGIIAIAIVSGAAFILKKSNKEGEK